MLIKTAEGDMIDSESKAYKDFLRRKAWAEKKGEYPEPAPYRTLGDVIELERRRIEHERELATVTEGKNAPSNDEAFSLPG